ncbi:MAG: hypothetical protein ACI9Y7_000577 [Dokdonia sp.]|jgi:hypothetical protein
MLFSQDYTHLIKLGFKVAFFILFIVLILIWTKKFSKRYNIKTLDSVIALTTLSLITTEPIQVLFRYASELFSKIIILLENNFLTSVEENTFVKIEAYRIVEVLIFFLAFLLSSYIISLLTKPVADNDLEARTKKEVLIKNFITINGIIIALYLSLAAIIAVPILESISDKKNDEIIASFEESMTIYDYSDTIQKKRYIQSLQQEFGSATSKLTSINPENIAALKNKLTNESNKMLDRIAQEFQEVKVAEKKALEELRNTVNANVTDQIKLKHKEELYGWYQSIRDFRLDRINNSLQDVKAHVLEKDSANSPTYTHTINIDKPNFFKSDIYSDKLSNLLDTPPKREPLGSNLNFFSYIAGWLINTGNKQLALIIGLLGFGLLGSIVRTFMKEKPTIISINSMQEDLMLSDVVGFIVRGFAAALVIFLAIKGGIAILTNGDSDLNLYMTFFLCFTAAVYSDKSWDWARKNFDKKINSGDSNPQEEDPNNTPTDTQQQELEEENGIKNIDPKDKDSQ